MSRKRVDAVRRAFDEWAGLTPEQQRELHAMITGFTLRGNDDGLVVPGDLAQKPTRKPRAKRTAPPAESA